MAYSIDRRKDKQQYGKIKSYQDKTSVHSLILLLFSLSFQFYRWPAENCFAHPSSTLYSQICNTSPTPSSQMHHMSNHNQQLCCNDQDYHLGASNKSAYNALYSSQSNAACAPYGMTHTATGNANYPYDHHHHHHHLPHSKSFEHYHEPTKLVETHALRNSFDNYKSNCECTDGTGNGHHGRQLGHSSDGMAYDRYQAMPTSTMGGSAYADPRNYTRTGNFDRNDTYANVNACCHQIPQYDCLTAFGSRPSTIQKPAAGLDYSDFNFPPK